VSVHVHVHDAQYGVIPVINLKFSIQLPYLQLCTCISAICTCTVQLGWPQTNTVQYFVHEHVCTILYYTSCQHLRINFSGLGRDTTMYSCIM
jgi:hypothetical protein